MPDFDVNDYERRRTIVALHWSKHPNAPQMQFPMTFEAEHPLRAALVMFGQYMFKNAPELLKELNALRAENEKLKEELAELKRK